MLAVWGYMDPTLVTQHELQRSTATAATQSFILTPRSVVTERLHESPAVDPTTDQQEGTNLSESAEASRSTQAVLPEEAIPDFPMGEGPEPRDLSDRLTETIIADLSDRLTEAQDENMALPVFTLDPSLTQSGSQDQTHLYSREL